MVDAQFSAWIDNDLNFMVKKEDGLTHKANRLSGGQKQQASIAYLLSVNDVFASSLGVLILDEPTGSMQEENAKDVAEAFGKLLQVGKATNRQFIVVTHSKSLAAYSDQIVGMPLT
jgi:putative ABC transport system ATP-binding protein